MSQTDNNKKCGDLVMVWFKRYPVAWIKYLPTGVHGQFSSTFSKCIQSNAAVAFLTSWLSKPGVTTPTHLAVGEPDYQSPVLQHQWILPLTLLQLHWLCVTNQPDTNSTILVGFEFQDMLILLHIVPKRLSRACIRNTTSQRWNSVKFPVCG